MNGKVYLSIAGVIVAIIFIIPWIGQAMPSNTPPVPQVSCPMGGGMMGGMMGQGMMGNPQWMRFRMQAIQSMPREYQGLRNPLKPTDENILSGGKLYQQTCAVCHGTTGRGDGPAGKTLNPPPAPLAFTVPMHMTTDGYLFWRIKDGGQQFGSAMPAWGVSLKEEQIWQIILYLRAGFPSLPADTINTQQGSSNPEE